MLLFLRHPFESLPSALIGSVLHRKAPRLACWLTAGYLLYPLLPCYEDSGEHFRPRQLLNSMALVSALVVSFLSPQSVFESTGRLLVDRGVHA